MEVIKDYGADVLRLTLITGNAPGNDMRFYYSRMDNSRNFGNKLWNAARFVMMHIGDSEPKLDKSKLTSADKWILSKVNTLAKEVTDNLDNYELGIAVQKVYDFIWDEYCDWYIEMVKPRLYNEEDETREAALWTLKTVLINALKMLHPFEPFITEEIFTSIQSEEETIMLSKWPEFTSEFDFEEDEKAIELMKEEKGVYDPAKLKKPVKMVETLSPLEQVIEKINEQYMGAFTEGDRVVITALHQKLKNNKKLMKSAQTDGRQIFENNIFPQLFDDAAQEAYIESTETYTKLFEDAGKYRAIMSALAHALFDELQQGKLQE